MKKILKIALVVSAAVLLLLIVAGVAVFVHLDRIAKSAVETAASNALGVETRLKSLKIELFAGRVSLADLNVANPSGFDSPHFLHLKEGKVEVSLGSLMSDKVVVPLLELDDLDMCLQKTEKGANYQVVMDHMSRSESSPGPAPAQQKPGKKYVINQLVLKNVVVHADLLPFGGQVTRTDVTIPEIRLNDVGSDSDNGVLLKDVSDTIVKAVMQAVVQKGGQLPAAIVFELGQGLGGLKDIPGQGIKVIGDVTGSAGQVLGGLGNGVGDVGGKVVGGVGNAVGGLGKTIGGGLGKLFGDKPKDQPASQPADSGQNN